MFLQFAQRVGRIYTFLDGEQPRKQLERLVVWLSACGFLAHLLLILIARSVPPLGSGVLAGLDRNYLHAIYTPFTFILFYEVLLLVFALPKSHTSSIGKQYEIISLIVVRRVFKDIGEFRDLESWLTQLEAARMVLLDMAGAVVMFLLVTLFYHMRKHVAKSATKRDLDGFILLKKVVAVLLSALLCALAGYNLFVWFGQTFAISMHAAEPAHDLDVFFFPAFFEFMIFTDVLLLIVSLSYYDRYEYVFRNAGFVISTVLLRFSLSTEKPFDVALALIAMAYGVAVLSVFAYFTRITATKGSADSHEHEPKLT